MFDLSQDGLFASHYNAELRRLLSLPENASNIRGECYLHRAVTRPPGCNVSGMRASVLTLIQLSDMSVSNSTSCVSKLCSRPRANSASTGASGTTHSAKHRRPVQFKQLAKSAPARRHRVRPTAGRGASSPTRARTQSASTVVGSRIAPHRVGAQTRHFLRTVPDTRASSPTSSRRSVQ